MYTTLNKIQENSPCKDGLETLLKHLGKTKPDDEPLPLLTILDSSGFDHALRGLRAVDGFEKEKLLLGITFAREVAHLMPAESKKALDVFERYANGLATEEEFEVARRAAWAAARAAWEADVAWEAICAARAARDAARADAAAAAWEAALAAADAAARASAWAPAARAAAYSTIRTKQETQLRQMLEKTCTQH